MTRVDLITGFLGAGKTTFIRRYLSHLEDQSVLIIENEFGSIGVDAGFLSKTHEDVEDLSGVCMCCRGRDQFIAMLVDAAARGYDRVLVEPSGIYDVDEFFGVMDDPRVAAGCQVGSILTIVDARVPEQLSEASKSLMFSQLMAAGAVVFSKTQLAPPGAEKSTLSWLNGLIAAHGGSHRLGSADICSVDWDALTDEDFARLRDCGCRREAHPRQTVNHDEIYESTLLAGWCADERDMRDRLHALMSQPRFGLVIRAKGHLRDARKNWYEVNCTRGELSLRPAPDIRRGVLVVIGQSLNNDALNALFPPRPRKA